MTTVALTIKIFFALLFGGKCYKWFIVKLRENHYMSSLTCLYSSFDGLLNQCENTLGVNSGKPENNTTQIHSYIRFKRNFDEITYF